MPFILRNKADRAAVQLAHASAMRSTNELIDQLQAQLKAERSQHAFDNAYHQEQITVLLREIAELRYRLAKMEREAAFAVAPSPSAMMH